MGTSFLIIKALFAHDKPYHLFLGGFLLSPKNGQVAVRILG